MNNEKIKLAIASAAAGAIVLAIVGFVWGGWVTASKAEVMYDEAARTAVTERLAPMCVTLYGLDPAKREKRAEMMKIDSWNRADYVGKQGWATLAGEKEPDSSVSRRCAELLAKLPS